MRHYLLALFIIPSFAGFCGQNPVKWHFLATPSSNLQNTMVVSTSMVMENIGNSWNHKNIRAKSEMTTGHETCGYLLLNLIKHCTFNALTSSMAKLTTSETAMWTTIGALQIHGGNGFVMEYHMERLFRDAKIIQIYEGTSEVQRIVISRYILDKNGFSPLEKQTENLVRENEMMEVTQ